MASRAARATAVAALAGLLAFAWCARPSLARVSAASAPAQARRVVDVVTLGDARSEQEHEYAGEAVTDGTVDGRVFRQTAAWQRVSLGVYDDTEVALIATFRGSAGQPIAFDLLVDGCTVEAPVFVSPSAAPVRVEYRVPFGCTRGATRICVTIRAVSGRSPGLIQLQTLQEHFER